MLSPLVYANTIIKRSLQTDVPVSPLKLQKLLYFLYAYYYSVNEQPLFAANFEKWKYGPVVSEVYQAFQKYGGNRITDFAYDCNGKVTVIDERHQAFSECLQAVWSKYGNYTGNELSTLTHGEGTAWSKAEGPFLKIEDIKEDGRHFFGQNSA